jgi:hypothetical protein
MARRHVIILDHFFLLVLNFIIVLCKLYSYLLIGLFVKEAMIVVWKNIYFRTGLSKICWKYSWTLDHHNLKKKITTTCGFHIQIRNLLVFSTNPSWFIGKLALFMNHIFCQTFCSTEGFIMQVLIQPIPHL